MSQDPQNQASLRIAEIASGGPEAGGEFVGIRLTLAEGGTLDLSLPAAMLEKLQMFLRHLGELAAATRAGRPTDFAHSEVFQPFTLAGEVSIRPTDQGPILLRGNTQEGLPISLAMPRDGARGLAQALLSMLDEAPTQPSRH